MGDKKEYSHTGFSWLGIGEENISFDEKKEVLESDCQLMQKALQELDNRVKHYHDLCKVYEKSAGTQDGPGILEQIDALTDEIEQLSDDFSQNFNETIRLTHLPKKNRQ